MAADEARAPFATHGEFVSGVDEVTTDLVADGWLTEAEHDRIMRAAARSDIGKEK